MKLPKRTVLRQVVGKKLSIHAVLLAVQSVQLNTKGLLASRLRHQSAKIGLCSQSETFLKEKPHERDYTSWC
jgi:hypothetical protein